MPATSPGLSGGGCTQKTSTWYLDQGQTCITFNYKHSQNSYFCLFQKQQKSVMGLEGPDKLIDDFCHLHKNEFVHFELPLFLLDTSSCKVGGRQVKVFL